MGYSIPRTRAQWIFEVEKKPTAKGEWKPEVPLATNVNIIYAYNDRYATKRQPIAEKGRS